MNEVEGVRIRIVANGPYVVQGEVPLTRRTIVTDEAGESVEWSAPEHLGSRPVASLCRCGQSGTKPFCDGSHVMAHFDGTETASRDTYEDSASVIEGPRVTLMDQTDLCADARFCAAKGKAWHLVEQDEDGVREIVTLESDLCPSGRYTAIGDDGLPHEPVLEPEIAAIEDPNAGCSGPLWVQGGIPILSADGETYPVRNRVTLCRCGQSGNKPFCDGTHIEVAFDDGAIKGSDATWW